MSQVFWHMPIIGALWKADVGGWNVWAQQGKFSNLVRPFLKIEKKKRVGDVAQCTQCEVSVQSLVPQQIKKKF